MKLPRTQGGYQTAIQSEAGRRGSLGGRAAQAGWQVAQTALRTAAFQVLNDMATTSTLLVCPGGAWCFGIFHRALRTVKEYTETVERIHLNPVRRGLVRQPGMEMAKLSRVRRGERGGTATTLLMSTRGFEKPLLALRKRDRDQTAIQRRSAVSAFLSAC